VQRAFADYNAGSREPMQVRVGRHAGEPVEDSNDLFGRTVQLAARLSDVAPPAEIVTSEVVRHRGLSRPAAGRPQRLRAAARMLRRGVAMRADRS
jgi:class 3 adenylate cyclase